MALLIKEEAAEPVARIAHSYRAWRTAELVLAAAAVVAAVLVILDVGGPASAAIKLLVCLLVPGWIAVSRLPAVDPAARLVWTFAVSAVVYALLAVVMAWTESWHPRPIVAAVLLAGAVALIVLPGRFRSELPALANRADEGRRPGSVVPWLILVTAVALWIAGLAQASNQKLDGFGLLRVFPEIWYIAVAVTTGLCIWGVVARSMFSSRLMVTASTALVLMLYSSATILAEVPRLPWTYKHIAVTDYIGAVGHVSPSLDIYNRWPGFFSLSAFLGEIMGYRDALDYAAWAETGFALVDTVIVLAIARNISRNRRVYWTATLVFILANYVNQNYYAPQAFSYTLYLTMCLVALTFLRDAPGRLGGFLERRLLAGRIFGQSPIIVPPELPNRWGPSSSRNQALAIVAILGIQVVIVVSHQLTPYLAVLGLLPLFLFGYFRPRWLGPALLAIALLYLVPNVAYIRSKYGLFSGWNFFKNTGYKAGPSDPIIFGEWTLTGQTLAHGAVVLTALTGLLALAGFIRRISQGKVRTTVVVAWLAFAPILSLLGQSYGGEARFRVYLFALPWLAIGVAWLFWSGPARTRRAARGAASCLSLMAVLFTIVYFQPEADYRVSREDVVAGKWLDSYVQKGDLVFETNYFFPLLIGPNYPYYLTGGNASSLSDFLRESEGDISVASVLDYAKGVQDAERTLIVLSDGQRQRAIQRELFDPEYLRVLERQLLKTEQARNVFDNGSVRIYEITGQG